MVSVIIPAYKAVKYIDECLNSIKGAEILVGVDACEQTLNHLKTRSGIRLFYFTENVGPYVIKNTLIDEASNEHILFFDSDDVLIDGVIEKVDELLNTTDYIKLNYTNFRIKPTEGKMMNDAVIAINRSTFNKLNGFMPWRCAADTELSYRLKYNKVKYEQLDGLAYYRRIHGENLTMKKETGHDSPVRQEYIKYINRCKRLIGWPKPLTKTKTQSYVTY